MNLVINLKKINNKIQPLLKINVLNTNLKKKIIKNLGIIDQSQEIKKVYFQKKNLSNWLVNSKIKNRKILFFLIKLYENEFNFKS